LDNAIQKYEKKKKNNVKRHFYEHIKPLKKKAKKNVVRGSLATSLGLVSMTAAGERRGPMERCRQLPGASTDHILVRYIMIQLSAFAGV
jgi:hypothetical protein